MNFKIYPLSEQAITIEFGEEISEDLLQQVSSFDQLVKQYPFNGFISTVPAYATLTIYFDPLLVIQSSLRGSNCLEKVSAYLKNLTEKKRALVKFDSNIVYIPVCYDEVFGLDLAEVANYHKLSIENVIALHSSAIYKVYMIGFVPGFAYLGGMDDQLTTPRKVTPRKLVPKGAVGIAGNQTGIYPLATPGGWQIIGSTPLMLFNAHRTQPSLLKVGDQVVFKQISLTEFSHLADQKDAD